MHLLEVVEIQMDKLQIFFEKAKSWVNLFISLRDKRKGYERA